MSTFKTVIIQIHDRSGAESWLRILPGLVFFWFIFSFMFIVHVAMTFTHEFLPGLTFFGCLGPVIIIFPCLSLKTQL